MSQAISENGLRVLAYLIENDGTDMTAQSIADALGFEKKSSVDGIVTAGLIRNRGLAERVAGPVVMNEKGKPSVIKYIKVTEAGKNYDHEAALAADAAAAAELAAQKAALKAAKAVD